jgi:serine/threonine protein phosphatase PrpC
MMAFQTTPLLVVFSCAVFAFKLAMVMAQSDDDGSVGAYFVSKTIIIPNDEKKDRGGEDAAATSNTAIVVADGVGGWLRHNIDPGYYSRLLTETVVRLAAESKTTRPLAEIVHDANIYASRQHLGTATCTTLRITDESTVSTLNIGDSGYSIHRITPSPDGDKKPRIGLLFASKPGQKQFNFPDQIGGQHGDVVAKVGVPNTHDFQDGDIFIVFSDGVSDNLWPEDFHPCISTFLDENSLDDPGLFTSYSSVADCIARTAYELGKDETFDSPFAKGARDAGWGPNYSGGKHDDITVTVATIWKGDSIGEQPEDPHFSESIYVYSGPVPALSDLTKKPPRKVSMDEDHEL